MLDGRVSLGLMTRCLKPELLETYRRAPPVARCVSIQVVVSVVYNFIERCDVCSMFVCLIVVSNHYDLFNTSI